MIYGYIRVSMMMIMNVFESCIKKKIKVIAIKENFELDDSIACKALMFAFGLSAEIERTLMVKPLPPLTAEPKKHGHPTYRELEWFKKHQ